MHWEGARGRLPRHGAGRATGGAYWTRTVYLLTTTAGPYFERFGFVRTARGDVPQALARSAEFAHACPASATCLSFAL